MRLEPEWIDAAQASQKATGVPASVSLAQFGLESGWGKHIPPGTNNPFGIKAPHGSGVEAETTEVQGGHTIVEEQPFAKFDSLEEAFTAHARLLSESPAYAAAMRALPNIPMFVRLMSVKYATDPMYSVKIMGIIHFGNLTQYDA